MLEKYDRKFFKIGEQMKALEDKIYLKASGTKQIGNGDSPGGDGSGDGVSNTSIKRLKGKAAIFEKDIGKLYELTDILNNEIETIKMDTLSKFRIKDFDFMKEEDSGVNTGPGSSRSIKEIIAKIEALNSKYDIVSKRVVKNYSEFKQFGDAYRQLQIENQFVINEEKAKEIQKDVLFLKEKISKILENGNLDENGDFKQQQQQQHL